MSEKIGKKQLPARRFYPSPSFPWIIVVVTLFSAFSFSNPVSAAQVTLAWDPNNESDLVAYKLYYKTETSGPPYHGVGATEGDSPILFLMENLSDPTNPEYTIHALDETATYFFSITACNGSGDESGYSNEVSYSPLNQPPMASFTVNPTSGQAPLNVVLDATASSDPDGIIESYTWLFGDGTSGASVITKLTAERLLLNGINTNKPEYWYPVFKSSIHTDNDKELITDVSFEIGIGKQRGETALSQGPVFSLFGEME